MSILPLGGFFTGCTYPGLILYVDSRCVSVVMRIDAVDLGKRISNYLREQLDNGITLVYCASMKGSAKRRRMMWAFVMKLSVATVVGSTSIRSQTEPQIVHIRV
jgi:hypothetical protein